MSSATIRARAPARGHRLTSLLATRLGAVLATALLAATCGLIGYSSAWAVLIVALLLAVVGTLWPWLSVRGLHARLEFARDRVREDEPIQATLVIRNRLPCPVVCLQAIDPSSGEPGLPWSWISRLPARSTARIVLSLPPVGRGRFPRQLPQIACAFPFGLWTSRAAIEVPVSMIVWPRPLEIDMHDVLRCDSGGSVHSRVHRPGPDGEAAGVRPYRRGDGMRQIHWRQTARHGRLIVREFQQSMRPGAALVLDTDLASYAMDEEEREQAIRLAAGLVEQLADLGGELTLIVDGNIHRGTAAAARRPLLDALALVASSGNPTLMELLPLARHLAAVSPVLITSQRIAEEYRSRRWSEIRCMAAISSRLGVGGGAP